MVLLDTGTIVTMDVQMIRNVNDITVANSQ